MFCKQGLQTTKIGREISRQAEYWCKSKLPRLCTVVFYPGVANSSTFNVDMRTAVLVCLFLHSSLLTEPFRIGWVGKHALWVPHFQLKHTLPMGAHCWSGDPTLVLCPPSSRCCHRFSALVDAVLIGQHAISSMMSVALWQPIRREELALAPARRFVTLPLFRAAASFEWQQCCRIVGVVELKCCAFNNLRHSCS